MPTVSTRVDALLWPTVFDQLKQLLAGYGGSILFADLAPFYAGIYPETDLRRVFYTGLSDGQNIILHDKQEQTRSPVQWAWDSLHLFGHMLQWHMNATQAASRSLKFFGANAQMMATKDFMGCSAKELVEMQTYEVEANRLNLALFKQCAKRLQTENVQAQLPEMIVDLQKYTAADIVFLTRYYTRSVSGEHEGDDLFSVERVLSLLDPASAPQRSAMKFKKIDQICVPVVHAGNNSSSGSLRNKDTK
jgi:phage-related protein